MSLEPIAIVGIGCRLPKADNPEAFWKLLRDGVDAITEVPPFRWPIEDYYDPDGRKPNKTNSRWGGFIENIDQFDPHFFGIAPREVPSMDPQQRLILEVAWEALEDGGHLHEKLAGTKTGVFVGIGSHDYWGMLWHQPVNDVYGTTGTASSLAANRLSYVLDLKGPSLAIDTACSSSLVAVHLACKSIWEGESVMALAGGVSVLLSPFGTIGFTKGGFLSSDGRCKSFDASANGYVRSEGAGIVVLKSLSRARANKDYIYAIIRGSAVNQDGRTDGIASPNLTSQVEVLRDAYQRAGINPSRVQYIEAHGTGTQVGDRIEAQSLGRVISTGRTGQNCLIGSVKSNIGHLETAAGIAGLIKVALCLKHQQIPPSLHFHRPNPQIEFNQLGLEVNTTLTSWSKLPEVPRIAGVNSFGFGGTNAHIVLEETPTLSENAPLSTPLVKGERPLHLLALSAKTESALRSLCERYRNFLMSHPLTSLPNICFTANTRRTHFNHRLVVWAKDKEELSQKLLKEAISERLQGKIPDGTPSKIAFLFAGQGSQYVNMGRELYETQPYFRKTIDKCAKVLQDTLDFSLIDVLYPKSELERQQLINNTIYTQPALFAVEYALAQLWQSWGIVPSVVLGHSLGEYVAACVAGVFSLEDGLKLVAQRGQLMAKLPSTGATIAVFASEETVSNYIADYPNVAIAAINGSRNWVLSGPKEEIEAIIEQLTAQGIKTTFLNTSHAFHSPLMEPMLSQLRELASAISYHQPKINIISNITGDFVADEITNPDYWCLHTLHCVKFAASIETLQKSGYQVLIEMGPKPTLLGMGKNNWQNQESSAFPLWLPSLRQGKSDWQQIFNSLGQLFVSGVSINWQEFDNAYYRRFVTLPTYPFQRQSYWWPTDLYRKKTDKIPHPLLGSRREGESVISFQSQINKNSPIYLKEHCLNDTAIFPAAAYLEMTLAAGYSVFEDFPICLESVKIEQFLALTESSIQLQINLRENGKDSYYFEVLSLVAKTETKNRHASGTINKNQAKEPTINLNLSQAKAECDRPLSSSQHYQNCQAQGLAYGATFQGIKELWWGQNKVLSKINLAETLIEEAKAYYIHPTLLDGCFQGLGAIISALNFEKTYLPVGIEELILYRSCPQVIWSYAEIEGSAETQTDILKANIRFWDKEGEIIGDIKGLSLLGINRQSQPGSFKQKTTEESLYETIWEIKPNTNKSQLNPRSHLMFLDKAELGLKLADSLRQKGDRIISVSPGEAYEQLGENYRVNPTQLTDIEQLFKHLQQNSISVENIIYLWGAENEKNLKDTQSLLFLIQCLDRLKFPLNSKLYLITRGTQAVTSDAPILNPFAASIWGLGRAIALEYPNLACISLDLDIIPSTEEVAFLTTEIASPDTEDRIAYRQNQRYVPRLSPKKPALKLPNSPFQLKTDGYGSLDRLTLVPLTHSSLKPDEVEIEVYAAGLNFRDVLNGLGMLQPYIEEMGLNNASEIPFGGECSGKIVAVGEFVTDFQVGDEVIAALALGSLASFVKVKAQFVTLKPQNLSYIEAATIPTTFLTACYGLQTLGNITASDRILIHSAAGGVGQAAVQLAQKIGASILATASSSKKQALESMGVHRVMNSRTLDFADEIKELTEGKGIDLVLNSFNGEYIAKNLEILSDKGRFIEIGKIGIWTEEQVKEKRPDVSYFPFDLLEIARDNPDLIARLWSELIPSFETGDLKPLPYTVFPIEEAVKAFRYMASAKHIGKVILTFPKNSSSLLNKDSNDAYLITGGWGGLGLKVSQWLAQKGAKQLILVGRSEPSPKAIEVIHHLEASGTKITIIKADVANSQEVKEIFSQFNYPSQRKTETKLRGIIHTAGILDDGLLLNQTWKRFEKVMEPKVMGTWNLHQASKDYPLDFFVCFSSIVSLIGSPGQGNYSAANAFMDALMHYRRNLGLSGLSINWGPWDDAGMAANLGKKNRFREMGFTPIASDWGLEILEKLLLQKESQVGVFSVDWASFCSQITLHQRSPFLSLVNSSVQSSIKAQAKSPVKSSQKRRKSAILQELDKASDRKKKDLLLNYLQTQLAKVLGFSSLDCLDIYEEFNQFGMDSLMAVEFKNIIQVDLAISLDTHLIFDYPTIDSLTNYLFKEVVTSISELPKEGLTSTQESSEINELLQPQGKSNISPSPFDFQSIENIPPEFYQFELSREYLSLEYESDRYQHLKNPFFASHEGMATNTITIEGRTLINYSSYNYLGLAGSPAVSRAAMAAIERYGTSVSASRILSGEIPLHQELEQEIADFLGTEDCIAYIGGHTTNTTTIGHLFNKNDLILYDALSHNSIRQGCSLSGATAIEFPHNDPQTLEKLLQQHRPHYEKVLIVIEGIYSTDGDIAPLPEAIALKKRYKTFLMIDEAHSIGVLGETGRGIGEYFDVDRSDVDLWMGTLSKSFASCGGYIAGSHALVQYLKYTAPGFVFSVGMSPGNAAAALASVRFLKTEPERVKRLKTNAQNFLSLAKALELNVGMSQDTPIIPIIVGESEKALKLGNILFQKGINVLPMIYPSVPDNGARLRFFLTFNHTEEQIHHTCNLVADCIKNSL